MATTEQRETLQYIFDYVADHLMEQGVRSISKGLLCLYSGPGGTQCAVGCLLRAGVGQDYDEWGTPLCDIDMASFEPEFTRGYGVGMVDDYHRIRELLRTLQSVHDGQVVANWPRRLLFAAIKHDLDPGILVTWA